MAAMVSMVAVSANALTDTQVASVKKAFRGVATPEIAAKAAKMVKQTSSADRKDMAVAIVKIVTAKNPALAASLVGAISEVAPEVSADVAVAATASVKGSAEAVTIAAAGAAPAYAEQIGQAVAKASPANASSILARSQSAAKSASSVAGGGTVNVTPGISSANGGISSYPSSIVTLPAQAAPGADPNRYGAH